MIFSAKLRVMDDKRNLMGYGPSVAKYHLEGGLPRSKSWEDKSERRGSPPPASQKALQPGFNKE
jgi:hypothetical protein